MCVCVCAAVHGVRLGEAEGRFLRASSSPPLFFPFFFRGVGGECFDCLGFIRRKGAERLVWFFYYFFWLLRMGWDGELVGELAGVEVFFQSSRVLERVLS